MSRKPWPRLSTSLPHERRPDACQACGLPREIEQLQRWRECDDDDRPTPVVVVLCRACADRLIEPHPRLYREVLCGEPCPGAMEVCRGCRHREGVTCTTPSARFNGGEGITFDPPRQRVHLCRSPRSKSGWYWIGPPITGCSGFAARDSLGPRP